MKKIIILLILLLLLTSCGEIVTEPLNFGVCDNIGAIESIYLDDERYNGIVYENEEILMDLMKNGQLDVCVLNTFDAVNLYFETKNISVIGIAAKNNIKVLVPYYEADNISSLFGSTLSVPHTRLDYIPLLNVVLANNNLAKDENINLVSYYTQYEVYEILSDNDECGLLYEPYAYELISKRGYNDIDFNQLLSPVFKGDYYTELIIVSNDYLSKYPKSVARFLEDYNKSIDTVKSNYEDASYSLIERGLMIGSLSIENIFQNNYYHKPSNKDYELLNTYFEELYKINPYIFEGDLADEEYFYKQ